MWYGLWIWVGGATVMWCMVYQTLATQTIHGLLMINRACGRGR